MEITYFINNWWNKGKIEVLGNVAYDNTRFNYCESVHCDDCVLGFSQPYTHKSIMKEGLNCQEYAEKLLSEFEVYNKNRHLEEARGNS